MEVKVTGRSEVTILGNIKKIEDYQAIKEAIREMIYKGEKDITIKVAESISMNSSVIGFMLKVVYEDRINLSVHVKDDRLYSLLETLNLLTAFNVKKL